MLRTLSGIYFVLLILNSCKSNVVLTSLVEKDPAKYTYLYSEALKYKMLGQSKLAADLFLECLELNPSSTASSYQLANLSIERSDYGEAKVFSDFCLKYMPKNEWYLVQRLEIAQKLNEFDIYTSLLKSLVDLVPSNLNYSYEYSIVLYQNKKYDEANTVLDKISDEVGMNENVSYLRNNINFALKRLDAIQLELLYLCKAFPDSSKYADLLAEFYLVNSQSEKAFDVYLSVIDKDSGNGAANLGLSWIYAQKGLFTEGYPFLIKGILSPYADVNRKLKVSDLYISSKNQLSFDSTNLLFEKLINLKQNNNDYLNKYIGFLYDNKQYVEVERYIRLSIDSFPENFSGWEYYFNLLMAQSRFEELKRHSLKALEYFPNHSIVYFFIGYSNFSLKNYNESINFLEIGLDYTSDNLDLQKQFYLFLAESYHSISNDKKSDFYFEKYLALDKSNAYVLNNYAFYLSKRSVNLDKAIEMSRKSIEIEPFNSSFLDTYAYILYILNDVDRALNYIERAYKQGGSSNYVIVEHYGDILYKKNNLDEALERWKEAFSLNRNNNSLLEKINKIELEN